MQRRDFLFAAACAALAAGPRSSLAGPLKEMREALQDDEFEIDPYFLDSGVIPLEEQALNQTYEQYLEMRAGGEPAVMPRGGRPRRAPSYRMMYWNGDIGERSARLVGPLSVEPGLPDLAGYQVNAQVLGFQADGLS